MTALTPLPDQKSLLPLSLTLPEPRNAISWGLRELLRKQSVDGELITKVAERAYERLRNYRS